MLYYVELNDTAPEIMDSKRLKEYACNIAEANNFEPEVKSIVGSGVNVENITNTQVAQLFQFMDESYYSIQEGTGLFSSISAKGELSLPFDLYKCSSEQIKVFNSMLLENEL